MQQISYVLNKDLHFTDANFTAKAGDVFVHTPPSQVVVYRNGNIEIQMGTTQASINGLAVSGVLSRIVTGAPVVEAPKAPKTEEPAPEVPKAEEPAPEPVAAPVVDTTPETEETPAETPVVPEAKTEEPAPKAEAKKAAKKK
jgi:outer membrane biosynthesis protein TonB